MDHLARTDLKRCTKWFLAQMDLEKCRKGSLGRLIFERSTKVLLVWTKLGGLQRDHWLGWIW